MPEEGSGSAEFGVEFGPERVMVVDDEPAVRRFLARAIEGRGYKAEALGSAREALERLPSREFAVVLADIGMPEHDGLWLLDRIMEMQGDLAVVMVTANNESRTAIDCLTRGASDYIIKPVNPGELAQVVARAMEGRRLRIENRVVQAGTRASGGGTHCPTAGDTHRTGAGQHHNRIGVPREHLPADGCS